MKKMAVFVEGLTEQAFVSKLVTEVANQNRVCVRKCRLRGGATRVRRVVEIEVAGDADCADYYVLVVDCGADNRVGSDVRDQYRTLVESGYSAIVAVRDLYPDFSLADVPKLERTLRYKLPTKPIEVVFSLGIMEVEAWFLAEHSHFARLGIKIPAGEISQHVGFDPFTCDAELRPHPAADLNSIYALAGLIYEKRREVIQRTVDAICYATMYCDLAPRLRGLRPLVQTLDRFLSDQPVDSEV